MILNNLQLPCNHIGKFELRRMDICPDVIKIICSTCNEFTFCYRTDLGDNTAC